MPGVVAFLGQTLASLRSATLVWAPQLQQKEKCPAGLIHCLEHWRAKLNLPFEVLAEEAKPPLQ